jgi:nitrate/nitrite-specific signal transduction histidine kinase
MHKITTKITFISTALSLLIMGIIGISLFLSVKDKQDAQTINTAGYERMLTQRITKQTFYALTQENPDFTDVERSLTQFKQNLHDLRYGNDARGIYAAPTKNIAKELELIAQSAIEFEKQVLHLQTLIQNLSGQHKELHTLTKNVSKTLETLKEPKNYASMQFYINHIAYHALHYFYDNSLETYQHIYNAFQKFDLLINQAHFESTLPAKSKQKIEALYQNWQRYATLITSLVETTNTIYKAKELLAHSNMALLNNIDLSVSHYTEYAETKKRLFPDFTGSHRYCCTYFNRDGYLLCL